jgi:hypothetical protein
MDASESRRDRGSRVAEELGAALRRQAAKTWRGVRSSHRAEKRGHAWRFRAGPEDGGRFLRVTHAAMAEGGWRAPGLLAQLETGRWLDRLHDGPETSLVLHEGGRLEARNA